MHPHETLNLVARLVPLGQDYPSFEKEVVSLIAKAVAEPKTAVGREPSKKQPVSPTLDELCVARACGKIPAIKAYRERTGLSLGEAKDAIEKAMLHIGWYFHGLDNYQNPGHPAYIFENIEPIPF